MNKTELKEKLTALNQAWDEDNYKEGSAWQQEHAKLAESYITTYPNHNFSDDEIASLIFSLNTDLQVRDYALGLIDPTSATQYDAWYQLMNRAPVAWRNAQACLASAIRYEQGNTADAVMLLANTKANYSVGKLLARVYSAGWEPKAFEQMRLELHPKVTAGIFNLVEVNA
jgi:hypothetical protein